MILSLKVSEAFQDVGSNPTGSTRALRPENTTPSVVVGPKGYRLDCLGTGDNRQATTVTAQTINANSQELAFAAAA